MARKCEHYIASKKRSCNFDAKPGFSFCGNHMPDMGQPGRRRVPCPWGFAHTCFEADLDKHKLKCPSHAQEMQCKAQKYFEQDVNAGPSAEAAHMPNVDVRHHGVGLDDARPNDTSAADRHAFVMAMGPEKFASLVRAVEEACSVVCAGAENLQPVSPPECDAYLQPDHERPFSLKHAKQQASIVGHMHLAGLLKDARQCTYIEFGAGKGYLSSMLADASEARQIVLVDVRGFRMKADRSLRKLDNLELTRLRVDIKDFQPAGVPGLDNTAPWVCIGKHLCGAATDFTLRCCASSLHALHSCAKQQQSQLQPQSQEHSQKQQQSPQQEQQSPQQQPHLQQPGVIADADDTSRGSLASCQDAAQQQRTADDANQAHHSCASSLGLAADNATSASIDIKLDTSQQDHTAGMQSCADSSCQEPAACGNSSTCDTHRADAGMQNWDAAPGQKCAAPSSDGQGIQGLAVATCCHHRCSWQHYVGKHTFRRLGFNPEEFEVVSWMTGWALCGHETPNLQEESWPESGDGRKQGGLDAEQAKVAAYPPADQQVITLSRSERICLGLKCKRLIDYGRKQWMVEQGFQMKSVLYISAEVSGENRLLLATRGIVPREAMMKQGMARPAQA